MPFTDRDGERWLVYIEGVLEPRLYQRHRATLPGRRLRFDSVAESRVTTELPAGSPFLPDPRLQDLLDQAQPVPPFLPFGWQPLESPAQAHRAIEWAAKVARAALADWSRRCLDTTLTLVARFAAGRRHSASGWRRRAARSPHRLRPR